MTAVFLKLLNMSIAASWVVAAVLVLRVLLKKAPKTVMCVLLGWFAMGLSVICAFAEESRQVCDMREIYGNAIIFLHRLYWE